MRCATYFGAGARPPADRALLLPLLGAALLCLGPRLSYCWLRVGPLTLTLLRRPPGRAWLRTPAPGRAGGTWALLLGPLCVSWRPEGRSRP